MRLGNAPQSVPVRPLAGSTATATVGGLAQARPTAGQPRRQALRPADAPVRHQAPLGPPPSPRRRAPSPQQLRLHASLHQDLAQVLATAGGEASVDDQAGGQDGSAAQGPADAAVQAAAAQQPGKVAPAARQLNADGMMLRLLRLACSGEGLGAEARMQLLQQLDAQRQATLGSPGTDGTGTTPPGAAWSVARYQTRARAQLEQARSGWRGAGMLAHTGRVAAVGQAACQLVASGLLAYSGIGPAWTTSIMALGALSQIPSTLLQGSVAKLQHGAHIETSKAQREAALADLLADLHGFVMQQLGEVQTLHRESLARVQAHLQLQHRNALSVYRA